MVAGTALLCLVQINMSIRPNVLCFGRFYDDIPGGMQRHVENLFISLVGKVDIVHLVPSRDRNGARFTLHGVPVIRKPSINLDGSLAFSPGLPIEALKLHRQYHFNLIHLHFPDPMSHLASLFLPSSIPRIITWHCDIIRQKKLLKYYRPFLIRALDQAKVIVVPTPMHISSSNELCFIKNASKFRIIPFGFDLRNFVNQHEDTERIQQEFPGKRIFALGRHVYYKGFDVLIRAMKQVGGNVQLLLGGTGPLTEQWRHEAETHGVKERVHFLGHISEKDLPAYYQACDIFCLPAVCKAEAFGIVQLEAMASGKPVISTKLNNGVDYVNQHGVTGLTVPPNDEKALADAVNYLFENESVRRNLGGNGRLLALKEFSLENLGERMFSLYSEVVAGNTPNCRH